MKRLWVALAILGAVVILSLGTSAMAGRIEGLINALKQLPPEDLEQVLENLEVSTIPAPVPKTGQTTSYYAGDDGALQKGVELPTPRFTDNEDGTVKDNLTGLVWTKNANLFGEMDWEDACAACNALSDEAEEELTDGSQPGDWRLPNVRELHSLQNYGCFYGLSNTLGTGEWTEGDPFTDVKYLIKYWSSTTTEGNPGNAYIVSILGGTVSANGKPYESHEVWCVRGGN